MAGLPYVLGNFCGFISRKAALSLAEYEDVYLPHASYI